MQVLARLFVGGSLLYFSFAKVGEPSAFLKSVRWYGILPEHPPLLLNMTATVVPWIELVGGLLLLLGLLRRGVGAVITLLVSAFTVAIVMQSLRIMADEGTSFWEIQFDCGCGSGEVVIWQKLVYNLLLVALSAYCVFARSEKLSLSLPGRKA